MKADDAKNEVILHYKSKIISDYLYFEEFEPEKKDQGCIKNIKNIIGNSILAH